MKPDAIQDILENPRYEGMISTISGVTDLVDSAFMTVITFVAFFIISVALLRNVLAGAYCAFPKFWDQVHDAHKENQDKAFYESIQGIKNGYKTASMGTLKTAVFRIIPDIKCMTDFDEGELSAKDYFIKAIPQMIIVVIIGVFIYNGYYRDFTSLVASTGAEFIDRTILSFDPVGAFDTLMNTSGRPAFASDDSMDEFGKNKNRVANDIYDQIITKYTDIKDADSKAELAGQIDTVVNEIFEENFKTWLGSETGEYSVVYRVEMVKSLDPVSATRQQSENGDQFQYAWKIGLGKEGSNTTGVNYAGSAMTNNIIFDSTTEAVNESWYISVKIGAKRNIVSDGNLGGAVNVVMPVGSEYTFANGTVPSTVKVTLPCTLTADTNTVEDKECTVTVTREQKDTYMTLKFTITGPDGYTVPTTITSNVAISPPIPVKLMIGNSLKSATITHIGNSLATADGAYELVGSDESCMVATKVETKPAE